MLTAVDRHVGGFVDPAAGDADGGGWAGDVVDDLVQGGERPSQRCGDPVFTAVVDATTAAAPPASMVVSRSVQQDFVSGQEMALRNASADTLNAGPVLRQEPPPLRVTITIGEVK
ncbi:MAG TPA: hypothetical protein VEF89_07145 [Solirubrobacteraceae bacterium]|nr:hypothetical protein [Solirubrobacteraceae bacterium]